MRVRIHRGTHEIGGSCVELESDGQCILLDAGLPLDSPLGATPSLPDIDRPSLIAIVISHPHLDHFGLLPVLPSVPTVMGSAARRILTATAPFMPYPASPTAGPDLIDRQTMTIGPYRITPYLVDHSAYDAYALLVEAGGKRLFYSGDLRLHGRKGSLVERLLSSPPSEIDTLLIEGTTLSRDGHTPEPRHEADIEDDFAHLFRQTEGLCLVQASAQNIDRMVTLYRACQKTRRILVIDLYAALVLEATGNPHVPQSHWQGVALCIPGKQRIQIKRNGWFETLGRHSRHRIYLDREIQSNPSEYVLLFRRLWMKDLDQIGNLRGGCFIHSQWEGYLREPRFQEIEAWRIRHELAFHLVHTSGHAHPDDLRKLARSLSPRKLVPIHTRAPDRFAGLFQPIELHEDGEWWEA